MIDKYDIEKFQWFLNKSKTKGTDVIKVVAGSNPNQWIVTYYPEKEEEKNHVNNN